MNNYKSPDSIPILKHSANGNEELCYEDVDKANCLDDLFTSVSTVDDSNIILPPFQLVTESFIDNVHILRTYIENIISTLDSNKAAGPDLVSHKLFKKTQVAVFPAHFVPYLINL